MSLRLFTAALGLLAIGSATQASATVVDVIFTGTINSTGNPTPLDVGGLLGPVNSSAQLLVGSKIVMDFRFDTANVVLFHLNGENRVVGSGTVTTTVNGHSTTQSGNLTDSYSGCNASGCGKMNISVIGGQNGGGSHKSS